MDSALSLRLKFENEENMTKEYIDELLASSELVKKLMVDTEEKYLSAIFKLIALAEIPYAEALEHTQKLIRYVNTHLATEEGFSYTGKSADIVPCYNAMVFESYVRFDRAESVEAQNALNWIKTYQLFERKLKTTWKGKGICKHGGCLNATPCYIGIGKTVRALITYNEYVNGDDSVAKQLIRQGTDYMLRHQFFLRLSEDKPISRNLTLSAFPQSYFLTLTDLIYIVGKCKLVHHSQCQRLMSLLEEKKMGNNQWKIEYIYSYKGYNSFESRRGHSEWLSNLYSLWLNL